jgi:hypothetical protein
MKNFGISKKNLNDSLLNELILIGNIAAYLIKVKKFSLGLSANKKIEHLNRMIPKNTLQKIKNLDAIEASQIRNSFFSLNLKIYEFPVHGMINSITNKSTLNNKIINLDPDLKLKDIEYLLRKGTFKDKFSKFTAADENNLRRSIILFNCILSEGLRPQDNLCFSSEILSEISFLRNKKEILNFLVKKAKKGNKLKVKKLLTDFPEEVSVKDTVNFLSSLSTDITPIWRNLHRKKKDYLYGNYALYKKIKFEKLPWSKRKLMPSFAIASFESSKARNIKHIQPFFRKRFLRAQNLSFLDPKFRVITEKKGSILENLKILKENYSKKL